MKQLLIALALVGCKHQASCEDAMTNAIEVVKATVHADPGKAGRAKDVLIDHCKTDKWSDAIVGCYAAAKDNPALTGCMNQLTKDQQDGMMKDLMPVLGGDTTGSAAR